MENKDVISSKIKNKFFEEQYLITSPYYKSDDESKILVAGDIHYHENTDKQLYKMLLCHVIETKPDFVVIPGDLIETSNFLQTIKEREFFESILLGIAEIAPVIITPGNHEIANFNKKLDRSNAPDTLKYFDSLNKYKNIYFLNNEQTKIKDSMFLGFSPRLDYYFKYGKEEGNEMVMEDYLKSGLKMVDNDYNILVSHITPEKFSDIEKVDLVISAHWHDGYLPKKLDKLVGNTNAGLFFTPLVKPYPGIVCRGVHDFGRGYLFVTQGYRKWTADIGIFNAFEKITANDVEKLIIRKPEDGMKKR